MRKSGLVVALLVASSSYCYSEIITGTTNNAAANGLTWQMPPLLPGSTGLTIGGVYYRYTIDKDPDADAQVHIQNEDAINGGLLYRNTDDWSGLPGNTIVNKFMLPQIPAEYFGDGSIEVEGEGTVSDPSVIYTYTYDTCADPLSSPSCPGYEDSMYQYLLDNGLLNQQVEVNDPLDDEFVQAALDQEVDRDEEDSDKADTDEEENKEEVNLEDALSVAENALNIVEGAVELTQLTAGNAAQFNTYVTRIIPGGVYDETLSFEAKDIPDNRQGLRVGLAQQLLHEQMVDSQYQLGNEARNE